MRILAEWVDDADGILRPYLRARVVGAAQDMIEELFLIDTGADRTVLSAGLLKKLELPVRLPPTGIGVAGIGGSASYVGVETTIEFTRDDGGVCRFNGTFTAFVNPSDSETSILGRDLLRIFDLIMSRSHGEIALLTGHHQYKIISS